MQFLYLRARISYGILLYTKESRLLKLYTSMAFTGELEHLHIVDIIQLVNTTRKSGTFSVKGDRGESRIIFSNGYIVGASHLNNKVRIGTVLVKMNAITADDLARALEVQKRAGKNRKPLISTLIELGKLGREDATRGLKKLIEMTLVELIGWDRGTFTLDTETIAVSPECSYPISKMEQEVGLDAQMLLMDALRIYDERERDRQTGKTVLSDEESFGEVIKVEGSEKGGSDGSVITADDLGLANLDHLERKMPESLPDDETFDPIEIHRQKIRETLADFSAADQEAFVSFLDRSTTSRVAGDGLQRQEGRAKGLIFFSEDELIKHSIMTICKGQDMLVFATDGDEELHRIVDQCLKIKVLPVVVFDSPDNAEGMLSREKFDGLRQEVRERYPTVTIIQLASFPDYAFMVRSFRDGIRAVFPKPAKETGKTTFIQDTIQFLEIFKSYIEGCFHGKNGPASTGSRMGEVKDRILALRNIDEPSDVSLAFLQSVSEEFERSITFIVHQTELTGDKAIGVYADKDAGPTSVTRLKVPLSMPSVFRDAVERGAVFFGASDDEVLKQHLFEAIGEPLSPQIVLLPMKRRGKTVVLIYGDYGGKEASPAEINLLEILANEAGLVLENAVYRKQLAKISQG